MNNGRDLRLFIACFTALVATAFGFIVRAMIMNDWAKEFGLTETQKGEIFGVGLWPFAISIVLFSLIIDRIGYGKALAFAFICHVLSMAITIATPTVAGKDAKTAYLMLYLGNFIVALANGTVEAVINPVVATMFSRDKTKWLNILHAGWPGGLVLGGVLTIAMTHFGIEDWRYKVAILGIPVLLYGLLSMGCAFPVNERVAAGVSYRSMLSEVGLLSVAVITSLIVFEVTRVFTEMGYLFQDVSWKEVVYKLNLPMLGEWAIDKALAVKLGIVAGISVLFGLISVSLGRFLFFFLVIIMIPLAITELGTDSWITPLMETSMKELAINPGWVLVYTSAIMMVLRFFAGPIVHKLSPLGLLAVSALLAIIGLVALSKTTGVMILVAATIYGFGKTFFWPTMLGVVSEQFPKGGALTLNLISGVGMLGVGVIGGALLGNIQDKEVDSQLLTNHKAIHEKVMGDTKQSIFGSYKAVDENKVKAATPEETKQINDVKEGAKKNALFTVAVFPVFMLICYLLLILYFKAKGGYQAKHLDAGVGISPGH